MADDIATLMVGMIGLWQNFSKVDCRDQPAIFMMSAVDRPAALAEDGACDEEPCKNTHRQALPCSGMVARL